MLQHPCLPAFARVLGLCSTFYSTQGRLLGHVWQTLQYSGVHVADVRWMLVGEGHQKPSPDSNLSASTATGPGSAPPAHNGVLIPAEDIPDLLSILQATSREQL